MRARVTKKYRAAINGGVDGIRTYYPGDVAEDRHAEIGIEMACAVNLEDDDDEMTPEDMRACKVAELDAIHEEHGSVIEGFAELRKRDKAEALIGYFWPESKGLTEYDNKAATPPENKAT